MSRNGANQLRERRRIRKIRFDHGSVEKFENARNIIRYNRD